MKLNFVSTLFDLRNIMGETLYVEFIWTSRDRTLRDDPRERYASLLAARGKTALAAAHDPSLVRHRPDLMPGELWRIFPASNDTQESAQSEAA
ncbi:MAG TPA: hypothetical protein VGF97_10615 [Rhizomicrobium sp.]|jgi:hypothetical protein